MKSRAVPGFGQGQVHAQVPGALHPWQGQGFVLLPLALAMRRLLLHVVGSGGAKQQVQVAPQHFSLQVFCVQDKSLCFDTRFCHHFKQLDLNVYFYVFLLHMPSTSLQLLRAWVAHS